MFGEPSQRVDPGGIVEKCPRRAARSGPAVPDGGNPEHSSIWNRLYRSLFRVFAPNSHLGGVPRREQVGVCVSHITVAEGDGAMGAHHIHRAGLDLRPGRYLVDFDRRTNIRQYVDLKRARFGPVNPPTAPDRLYELALTDRPPDRFDARVRMARAVDSNATAVAHANPAADLRVADIALVVGLDFLHLNSEHHACDPFHLADRG